MHNIIIILLLKPPAQAQVWKTKLFINCFRNHTSTCATENWRKHNSGEQPTVDCPLEPIQRSGVKNSVGKVISQSNLSRQERPSKLGRSTPSYFKLQWMSSGRSSEMSNSSRSRWKLAEQTVIRIRINLVQHTKPSHTTSVTRQETLIGTKIGHRIHLALKKLKLGSIVLPTSENNTQVLGERIQNGNEVTQRCPQIYVSPTSKYKFSERHGKQYHAHGLWR